MYNTRILRTKPDTSKETNIRFEQREKIARYYDMIYGEDKASPLAIRHYSDEDTEMITKEQVKGYSKEDEELIYEIKSEPEHTQRKGYQHHARRNGRQIY